MRARLAWSLPITSGSEQGNKQVKTHSIRSTVLSHPLRRVLCCMFVHLRLLLLGLLLLVSDVTATVKRGEAWMYTAMFPATDKPLLKSAIEADREGKAALNTLLKYYEDMDFKMRASVTEDDYDKLQDSNVVRFLRFYGWPEMNKTELVFETAMSRGPQDDARYREEKKQFAIAEERVFKALISLGNALDSPIAARSVKEFTASRNVTPWDHVFHNSGTNYTTEDETHKCVIRSNLAMRINGSWAVQASVTNDRPTAFKRETERIYLREMFHFSKVTGDIHFQPYMFDINYKPEVKYWGKRPYNKGSDEAFVPTVVSSVFAEFGGPASIRFFLSRPLKDNIALRAALESSEDLTRIVLDTQVWSNTAILLFPLVLALVPLALFADPSDRLLLGYMVFTDFLSVMPLAITGGVLISVGQQEYFSTRTLVRGTPSLVGTTLAASTWSCKCEAAGNITAYGVAFVTIAIVAVITGVSLEIIVKNKVDANNLAAQKKYSQFSSEADYFWVPKCLECDCHTLSSTEPSSASLPSIGGGLLGQIRQRRKEESQSSIYDSMGIGR